MKKKNKTYKVSGLFVLWCKIMKKVYPELNRLKFFMKKSGWKAYYEIS